MSYARFSATSDIYVFHNGFGYECCACGLNPGRHWVTDTAGDMADHIEELVAAGHLVPDGLIDRLRGHA